MIFSPTLSVDADLAKAPDYAAWTRAAIAADGKSGMQAWRDADESKHFDYRAIRARLERLRKLSAAWLIDRCGWKGHRDGDAGVAPGHALVLVNHGRAGGAELLALARRIAASVRLRFGVDLEPEPRIVGATW